MDDVARELASGISRRRMLRKLTGAAIGGGLAAIGANEAGARKKKRRGGKRKRRPSQCAICNENCPGAAETTPTKALSFAPTGDPNFCTVLVNLTGFAGCTSFTAEYWAKAIGDLGDVAFSPTGPSGSSQTTLGSFAQGGELDIRINAVVTNWTAVSC